MQTRNMKVEISTYTQNPVLASRIERVQTLITHIVASTETLGRKDSLRLPIASMNVQHTHTTNN